MARLVQVFTYSTTIAALLSFNIAKLAYATCSSDSISIPAISGGKVLSFVAAPVTNFTSPDAPSTSISFCNITVIYTHPGYGDSITTQAWLPSSEWNRRLQAIGGGGYVGTEGFTNMAPAVTDKYAAVTSDLGVGTISGNSSTWSLNAANKVHLALLSDFAAVGLNYASIIAKAVVKSCHSSLPKLSHWNGCSTGGRQGMMLAQRYPGAFDGSVARAPAFH